MAWRNDDLPVAPVVITNTYYNSSKKVITITGIVVSNSDKLTFAYWSEKSNVSVMLNYLCNFILNFILFALK